MNTTGGTPQLALNDGGTAVYAGGSGSATLTFDYVVASGQETSDLDYASTAALALNGGSIQAQSGNVTALLTLPATGTDNFAGLGIVIATPPTVTGVSPASGPFAGGTQVTITGAGFTARPKWTSARLRRPVLSSTRRRRSRPQVLPARCRPAQSTLP